MQPIFDGHNDVLMRLWELSLTGTDPVRAFIEGTQDGQLDLPRARKGGMTGGLCAIFIPSKGRQQTSIDMFPMACPLPHNEALNTANTFIEIAKGIEQHQGWKLCTSVDEIHQCISDKRFAAILHMEGAEPLDTELTLLDHFYAQGLRSLGPVWSRHNDFGHGVPFRSPLSPDTGPGLTDAGKRLVKECNRLGIVIDLAHLNEAGFWDVAQYSDAPLVASHSNVHQLSPAARNLTDRQLDAIAERQGLVGLNYATNMLRADGRVDGSTPLETMRQHLDYLIERIGVECVALGSDFDGAPIPDAIKDAAGLPTLVEHLHSNGYDSNTLAGLCHDNWLRILETCWK